MNHEPQLLKKDLFTDSNTKFMSLCMVGIVSEPVNEEELNQSKTYDN